MTITRDDINTELVRGLVAAQFSQWANLPIAPVAFSGWDNRTFHLGSDMTVRLPSAEGYAAQVDKEHQWLPRLAPRLPLPIPVPLAKGVPSDDFPWPWSIYRWIEGETAASGAIADLTQWAIALAQFLVALQQIDAADGPVPGPHNFFRGGPLSVYDAESRNAIAALNGEIDAGAAMAVWQAALDATCHGPPVWVHGDVAVGNLLVRDGRLSAVIDWGCCALGDPACDMVIAWMLLHGESRKAFRATLAVDDPTWERGRGWALWKALITLAEYIETDSGKAGDARRVINNVVADHHSRGPRNEQA